MDPVPGTPEFIKRIRFVQTMLMDLSKVAPGYIDPNPLTPEERDQLLAEKKRLDEAWIAYDEAERKKKKGKPVTIDLDDEDMGIGEGEFTWRNRVSKEYLASRRNTPPPPWWKDYREEYMISGINQAQNRSFQVPQLSKKNQWEELRQDVQNWEEILNGIAVKHHINPSRLKYLRDWITTATDPVIRNKYPEEFEREYSKPKLLEAIEQQRREEVEWGPDVNPDPNHPSRVKLRNLSEAQIEVLQKLIETLYPN